MDRQHTSSTTHKKSQTEIISTERKPFVSTPDQIKSLKSGVKHIFDRPDSNYLESNPTKAVVSNVLEPAVFQLNKLVKSHFDDVCSAELQIEYECSNCEVVEARIFMTGESCSRVIRVFANAGGDGEALVSFWGLHGGVLDLIMSSDRASNVAIEIELSTHNASVRLDAETEFFDFLVAELIGFGELLRQQSPSPT